MRVLVACEFSGRVREAFAARGHDAWSVDLLDTEIPGKHIVGNVLEVMRESWDMMLAFPPCTYLALSGARWHAGTSRQKEALEFIRELMKAPVSMLAIENPIGAISSHIRRPDQIIQPYWFGHSESKSTCLWLTALPPLVPTDIIRPEFDGVWVAAPGLRPLEKSFPDLPGYR